MYDCSERDILIWLNSIGINNRVCGILYNYFSDLRELFTIDKDIIYKIKGIKEKDLNKITNNRNAENLKKLLEYLDQNNIRVITIFDQDYPKNLQYIYDKPYVLYQKGELADDDAISIGIVGARKATTYGKWACEKFAKELANLGITIISGLALGIDSIAHKTAMEQGGRTIGVLGCGIDQIYPKQNRELYRQMENKGSILTEFPLQTPPMAYNFPQRNRIIAGLSLGIIVIEAKEKSGSLITAHQALEQGKDIFALPGNINSIYSGGTNKLIKDGANPLLSIDDLLEEIYELKERKLRYRKNEINFSELGETETKIVEAMKDGPIHCDLISYKTGINISTVISTLTILELKGIIKELNNQIFTLK